MSKEWDEKIRKLVGKATYSSQTRDWRGQITYLFVTAKRLALISKEPGRKEITIDLEQIAKLERAGHELRAHLKDGSIKRFDVESVDKVDEVIDAIKKIKKLEIVPLRLLLAS